MVDLLESRRLFAAAAFPGIVLPIANGPAAVLSADVDGDGQPDLLAQNSVGKTLSVIRNLGGRKFASTIDIVLPARVLSLTLNDYDGDGTREPLAVTYSGSAVSVYRVGLSSATLLSTVAAPAGIQSILPFDMTQDGRVDLAATRVSGSTSEIQLFQQQANGTLVAKPPVSSGAYSLQVADVDADGDADLVVEEDFTTISILKNDGAGHFAAPAYLPVIPAQITDLQLGDIDGDHDADIVVGSIISSSSNGTLRTYRNDGTGLFTAGSTLTLGNGNNRVALADTDVDGDLDVIVTTLDHAEFASNNGSGVFTRVSAPLVTGATALRSVAADLDADGLPDLITPISTDGSVIGKTLTILWGSVAPTAVGGLETAAGIATTGLGRVKEIDIDGDGLDELVGGYITRTITVQRNVIGAYATIATFNFADTVYDFGFADFNRDGRPDLAVLSGAGGSSKLSVLLGDGTARGFGTPVTTSLGTHSSLSFALADFDGDGATDVAMAYAGAGASSAEPGQVDLFRNASATGTSFIAAGSVTMPAITDTIAAADFDGDGKADLASVNKSSGKAWVRFGLGANSFGAAQLVLATTSITALAASIDPTADGRPDLLIGGAASLYLLSGISPGTAVTQQQFGVAGVYSAVFGDLDGDGNSEMLVSASDNHSVNVLYGDGAGHFSSPERYATSLTPEYLFAADYDGDGDVDIVAYTATQLQVLRNGRLRDQTPPVIVSVVADYDTPGQLSVKLTFDESVGGSIQGADFVLTNLRTAAKTIPTFSNKPVDRTLQLYASYSTTNPPTDFRFTILGQSIADFTGNSNAAELTFDIHYLPGDANHDRVVNFDDLIILAQNYNTAGKTFSQGNFNFDAAGSVNFDDLIILAQRYNTSLVVAPLEAAAATTKRKSAARGPVLVI